MKTRNLIALSIIAIATFYNANAQEHAEHEYLIDLKTSKVTGFGNTHSDYSMINGKLVRTSGLAGAVMFNYQYYVGIYSLDLNTTLPWNDVYHISSETNTLEPLNLNNKLCFTHGGFMFGYVHNPLKLIHMNTNIKVGSGTIGLIDKDINITNFDKHHRDRVTVITPEVGFEINLVRWCKFGMSAGYRMVLGVDETTYLNEQGNSQTLFKSSDFSSPLVSVMFHFGGFGPRAKKKDKLN